MTQDISNVTFKLDSIRTPGENAVWMRIAQDLLSLRKTGCAKNGSRIWLEETSDQVRVFVQLLERPTNRTVWVLWRSAGRCYYGEQLWIRSVALRSGHCAVSGSPVAKGEKIYRPRSGKVHPLNARAVILATVVEAESSTAE